MDSRILREVVRVSKTIHGNPSSLHESGRAARNIIEESRKKVSRILGCRSEEIIFTGSGTEANNLAILGTPEGHVVTTNIEHHSVLRPLEKRGSITFVPVKPNGIVDPNDIAKALRPDTVLVSVMYANNEIGTIQDITKISRIIKNSFPTLVTSHLPLLHTDACQAPEYLKLNVHELGVDLMTLNGSKIYGPKGIGCLYVRRGINIEPLIFGGDQERGLRPGTENVALIAGFASALELAERTRIKESTRLIKLRDEFIGRIIREIPQSYLNGDATNRLPNNINISFEDIDGPLRQGSSEASEMLVLILDQEGIEVSTGAACTTTETGPSHVILALEKARRMTLSDPELVEGESKGDGNLRITLGRQTTKKDILHAIKVIADCVYKTRKARG